MTSVRSVLQRIASVRGPLTSQGYFESQHIVVDPTKRFAAKRVSDKYRLPARTRWMWLSLLGCWTVALVTAILFLIGASARPHWAILTLAMLMVASMLMFTVVGPLMWVVLRRLRTKALARCAEEMCVRDIAFVVKPGWAEELTPEQFAA